MVLQDDPPVDSDFRILAPGGLILYIPTTQEGWQSIPNLGPWEIFTVCNCHPAYRVVPMTVFSNVVNELSQNHLAVLQIFLAT